MTLKDRLKKIIVEELNLVDVVPEEIEDDDPLFGDRFGLDSIDAVELVFQLKKHFWVVIKNQNEGRSIRLFSTLNYSRSESQFSTFRSGTRSNSLVLFVTSTVSRNRACVAISRSMAPIGVPSF